MSDKLTERLSSDDAELYLQGKEAGRKAEAAHILEILESKRKEQEKLWTNLLSKGHPCLRYADTKVLAIFKKLKEIEKLIQENPFTMKDNKKRLRKTDTEV